MFKALISLEGEHSGSANARQQTVSSLQLPWSLSPHPRFTDMHTALAFGRQKPEREQCVAPYKSAA